MPRKRSSELEMNFDGLTDSVTNLVGALILLVVLIIGVTKEAISQQDTARRTQPNVKRRSGEKPIGPLQTRVNILHAQLKGVDRDTRSLEGELKRINRDVDNLLKKVREVPKPKRKKTPPKKTIVKKVPYRPPFERKVKKITPLEFVCEDGRVSIYSAKAALQALNAASKMKKLNRNQVVQVPKGDFNVKFLLAAGSVFAIELVRKTGHEGETLESITNSGSRFQAHLRPLDPKKNVTPFHVFSNAFPLFRKVRDIARKKEFDISWSPRPAGEKIVLIYRRGTGGGITVN